MAVLLVIGGTGFFGKSVLDEFRRGLLAPWEIDKVIAMSRNPDQLKLEAPELLGPRVELYAADIAKTDTLPAADYVIHAAASTDAALYISQPDEERENIIAGTLNYCRLAPVYHAKSKIIYTSSGAVYGYQPKGIEKLTEDMGFGNVENLSETKKSYAYAKRDAENAIIQLGKKGLNISIARCFAFVGRNLPRDNHFAIGNFIENGLNREFIQIKANGLVYRSYMYADDLVEWLMTIAENSSPNCEIYNVGSDESYGIRDHATTVGNYFKIEVKVKSPLLDQVDRYIPSIDKAKVKLNLINKVNIEKSIELSVE